jgi:hypothetical protein
LVAATVVVVLIDRPSSLQSQSLQSVHHSDHAVTDPVNRSSEVGEPTGETR